AARLVVRALFAIYLFAWLTSTGAWMSARTGPHPMLISNMALALISTVLIYVAARIDFEPPYRVEPPGVWTLIFLTYALAIAGAGCFGDIAGASGFTTHLLPLSMEISL